MATIKIYLDKRTSNKLGQHPVRLQFNSNSKTVYYSFNVFANENDWDKSNDCVTSSDKKFKTKNKLIQETYERAEKFLEEMTSKGRLPSEPKKIRDLFSQNDNEILSFNKVFELFMESKNGKTKEVYQLTYGRIKDFTKVELYFEDINLAWLNKFDNFLEKRGNKINSRGIHFRNIRSVFNHAIDNDIINAGFYPFRKFKIKKERTAKRAISLNNFKNIIGYKGSEQEEWARDVFMLSFYFIGINMIDLFENVTIEDGFLTYNRAKTNRLYSIKIIPEVDILIQKFKGNNHTFNFCEQFKLNKSFYSKVNEYLALIAIELKIPKFTTYSARHSWATFAGELEIPKETISASLGHGGSGVTDIYINFNQNKIDDANRKVIDYISS
jgi:integrase